MSEELANLAKRIREEVELIERSLQKTDEGWRVFQASGNEDYLDSVALNLHGFYSGLERIFEFVAEVIDGTKPSGENWHQTLLRQAATERPSVRPAVISIDSCNHLDEFRRFRHVVRNAYTFKFDPVKIAQLIDQTPRLFSQLQAELLAFADFLDQAVSD